MSVEEHYGQPDIVMNDVSAGSTTNVLGFRGPGKVGNHDVPGQFGVSANLNSGQHVEGFDDHGVFPLDDDVSEEIDRALALQNAHHSPGSSLPLSPSLSHAQFHQASTPQNSQHVANQQGLPHTASSADDESESETISASSSDRPLTPRERRASEREDSSALSLVQDGRVSKKPPRVPRYPPVAHTTGGCRMLREKSASPTETQASPTTSPAAQDAPKGSKTGDDKTVKITWTDAARFDLFLQIAYERRHEAVSEHAWKRIAGGCHGGPFEKASWNGVRMEYSRLMKERFPGFCTKGTEDDERAKKLDNVAAAQERGEPSTVPDSALNHNITDANTEFPPKQQDSSEKPKRNAKNTDPNKKRGNRSSGGSGRGGNQNSHGDQESDDSGPYYTTALAEELVSS